MLENVNINLQFHMNIPFLPKYALYGDMPAFRSDLNESLLDHVFVHVHCNVRIKDNCLIINIYCIFLLHI